MRRALALVPIALLVAGCGSEPSAFDKSGEQLKDAGSSRIEWKVEQAEPKWPFSAAVGSIDYVHNRGELIVGLKSEASPKTELRTLFIGRVSYMGAPYRGKVLWQKSTEKEATGVDRLEPGTGGSRPDEVLDLLIKSSDKVESLGNDEIRGVSAEHYRAHIDEKVIGESRILYPPGGLVIDAWIDDEGLLRRIRIPFGGDKDPVEVIDLYDFGVAVEVEAPPADQVVSEKEFNRLIEAECVASKRAGDEDPWCFLFGSVLVGSGGSDEMPTETMPRTVTEPK
jgi:hypothetical protein